MTVEVTGPSPYPAPPGRRVAKGSAVRKDLVDLLEDVEHVMLDFDAVRSAPEVPGVTDMLAAAQRSERALSIVGGEAPETVRAHLEDHGLLAHFAAIEVRAGVDEALSGYAAQSGRSPEQARRTSILVGGSPGDVEAAAAAGVPHVVAGPSVLAAALNARWDAQWCVRQGCC